MPTIIDETVVNQPYDTSGNGGRKIARTESGVLVFAVKNPSAPSEIRLYKKVGTNAPQLLANFSTPNLIDVAIWRIKGEIVGILYSYNGNTVSFRTVDATTGTLSAVTNLDTVNVPGNVTLITNDTFTELHAAWASKNSTYPNSFNIRYAKGTINADGSVTWGAVEQVTTRNTSGIPFYLEPSIVINNNGVPVIICSFDGGSDFNKCIKAIEKSSGNWSERNVYDSVSIYYKQSSPSACVAPNGRIWVAWHGGDSGESTSNIRVSYSDDGGITWSPMQKLTNSTANHYQISASITVNKNNEIFIVWSGYVNTATGDIRVRKIKNSSGSWGSITDVTASNTENVHRYPSALFDLNVNFTEPLFIYKTNSKVGFYGTWTVNTISVTPGYIGQKTSSDKSNILTYSITTDGEMSDITEKINGVTIATRTNPTSGQQFAVSLSQEQWDAIKYGNGHTLTIEMGSNKWTYTFDKRLNANDDILSAVKGVQDLQDHLNAVKAQLGSAIRAKGGTVNDTDAWSAFVSAVGTLGYSGSTRKASGTVTSSSSTLAFANGSGGTTNAYYITVTGLSFTPSYILTFESTIGDFGIYDKNKPDNVNINQPISLCSGNTFTKIKLTGNAYVNGNGFQIPVSTNYANKIYTWIAFE